MANYSDIRYAVTGTDVYSDITDLPLSGVDTGTQAFVSGSNRLYMWTGTGWYNIALINTDPSLSGASATYTLNTDGSNTVVTLASSDPEGLPISFSLSTSGLGVGANAIASVTQSNNIFTFTPTTNTALAGTFTATFTASDGVNLSVANSSFTLAFTVNNSNYTTALITSVGANNQVNNTFVDSSTNSHTITAAGNATQTTFSPYRSGGYSTYFDGSGDYLRADTALDGLTSGSSPWTIDFWIYSISDLSLGSYYPIGINRASDGVNIFLWGGENIIYSGGGSTSLGVSFPLKTWVYVQLIYDGTSLKIYHDGSLTSTTSTGALSTALSSCVFGIATEFDAANGGTPGNYFNGYLRDFRVTEGALTAATSAPTEPVSLETNTTLLTCHLPYIADGSTNETAITIYGNTKTEPYSPYDYSSYSTTIHGGSAYLDGTDDYLRADAALDGLTSTSDPWTLEAWVRPERTPGSAGSTVNDLVFGVNTASAGGNVFSLATGLTFVGSDINLNTKPQPYTWNHMAAVYDGSVLKIYLNGILINTHTWTPSTAFADCVLGIGTEFDAADGGTPGNYFQGNISNVRVTTSAVYTSNFTPPTTPLTAITNTSLLINGTNAGIIDKSQSVQTLTLNGDVKSSTTQSKYLTSSMYFDGTGDFIFLDSNARFGYGTGDFTLECWAYKVANPVGGDAGIIEHRPSSTNGGYPLVGVNTSGQLFYYSNATLRISPSASTALTNQTWVHIAYVRSGGNLGTLYIDGTSVGTWADNTTYSSSAPLWIGQHAFAGQPFNGYLSDVRITKGLARYTSNFTPPTAALQG